MHARLILLVLVAVAALLASAPAGFSTNQTEIRLAGDGNCDGVVDTLDALGALRISAGLPEAIDCQTYLDVDCDSDVKAIDALLILRYAAGAPASVQEGCSQLGLVASGPGQDAIAAYLAGRITTGDLGAALQAVEEALARGGVTVGTENSTYVLAFQPSTTSHAVPIETLNLTLEARDRESVYRMTAAEVGEILSDFGWPFPEGSDPGAKVAEFLRVWIQGALNDTLSIQSFTPLFLWEMSQSQQPPVNLLEGTLDPEDIHLSLLELELLAAAFDRVTVKQTEPPELTGPAAATAPCSEFTDFISKHLGPFAGQLTGFVLSNAGSEGISNALEMIGVNPGTVGDFGKAMSGVAIVARIWKLIAFYSSINVSVSVLDENVAHKWLESEAQQLKAFKARAGVSDDDWNSYVNKHGKQAVEVNQAIRDCLSSLGIPTFADLGELVSDIPKWAVEWTLYAEPQHVNWSPADQQPGGSPHLGKWRSSLDVTGHAGETLFIVRVDDEREADHPGDEKTSEVVACAEVDASQAPSLSTFINAAAGGLGLADSLVELAGGWLQKMHKPRGCTPLYVTYHLPCGAQPSVVQGESAGNVFQFPCSYRGTFSTSRTVTTNGPGLSHRLTESLSGTVTFEIDADMSGVPYWARYRIESGSAQWTLTGRTDTSPPPESCDFSGGAQIAVNPIDGDLVILQMPGDSPTFSSTIFLTSMPGNVLGSVTCTNSGTEPMPAFHYLLMDSRGEQPVELSGGTSTFSGEETELETISSGGVTQTFEYTWRWSFEPIALTCPAAVPPLAGQGQC